MSSTKLHTAKYDNDPKAALKISALVAVIAVSIGAPYQLCMTCPDLNPVNIAVVSSILGAAMAIILYKQFNETPSALTRRLNRVKPAPAPPSDLRVWIDGCFDLTHAGHFNAWRQGKAFGTTLVVGINPDDEVTKYKGPPVYTQEERFVMASQCKWVDEVVENVPYVMSDEYLRQVVLNPAEKNCDLVCHGSDPCLTPDGKDVFEAAKALGKYREYNRTEGVSTTNFIGRMLSLSKRHHNQAELRDPQTDLDDEDSGEGIDSPTFGAQLRRIVTDADSATNTGAFQRITAFMPTTRRLTEFASPKPKRPEQITVYCDGTWDMFNPAHVDFLKAIHEHGRANGQSYFVVVGVYSDNVANALHGENYPILNLQERVISILSSKYVDDVVIGAPYKLNREFLVNIDAKYVFHGTTNDTRPHLQALVTKEADLINPPSSPRSNDQSVESLDPYEYAKEHNMLIQLKSPRTTTIKTIIQRVIAHKQAFEAKFEKKNKAEAEYNSTKTFVQEL